MSNTSLDLLNKLPAEQVSIIREVVTAANSQGLSVFIVGAQARDLVLQYAYGLPVNRATNDIDFGIIVESWEEFTERDAEDLGLIMHHYLDAGNQDRVYSEQGDCFDLLNEEFDYAKASARVLGRDVGRVLIDASRRIVEQVLSPDSYEAGVDVLAMTVSRKRVGYDDDYDVATGMLAELRTGISEVKGSE